MVNTSDITATPRPGDQLFADWVADLPIALSDVDQARVASAWHWAQRDYADECRLSGDRQIDHALNVADILAGLALDADSLIAALLHDLPSVAGVDTATIANEFGPTVASLIEGCARMRQVSHLHGGGSSGNEAARAEALRKMLLAMASDTRVVFLVLAERLDDMRALPTQSADRQYQLARETLDLHAPLANRLGIWQIKWELEDRAFRYLDPVAYQRIARLLSEKRIDRERFIESMKTRLEQGLAKAGIEAEVTGRPKHLYSIWRKMQRKGLGFNDLFDLRAFRILVASVPDCYAALGVVHSLWQPIPKEFDDYIASPKENQYRSLHTAIVGSGARAVEVQIRTYAMHAQSELGVAAHWRYKEGRSADPDFDDRVAWLRRLLETPADTNGNEDLIDRFRAEVFADRVYVMTPQGDVQDLPQGSTPLDFAYSIHSDLGHQCRGARINGRMVGLTRVLETGDRVEILTARNSRPSRDWLNPALGYLASPRARAKVRAWFRQQDYDKNAEVGRGLLERELHRLGLDDVNFEALAAESRFPKLADFLAAIGRGDITGAQIAGLLRERLLPAPTTPEALIKPRRRQHPSAAQTDADINIYGVGNLLTRLGRCCQPAPGDAIIGFITRGEGVTIHRCDCANVAHLEKTAPERLIEVSWQSDTERSYAVTIIVEAYDRQGLIGDISALLKHEQINVTAVNTQTDPQDQVARMTITAEVGDVNQLSRIMERIAGLRNVRDVHRAR